ncbi:MAG: transposase [Pseudomonadota bacterium]
MSIYVRPDVSGATVFFTVCLAHRQSTMLVDDVVLLRKAVRETKAELPFEIMAWVTLPDHIHAIWRLPDGDKEFGKRWGMIKSKFSRGVLRRHGWPKQKVEVDPNGRVRVAHQDPKDERCAMRTLRHSQIARRETGIWQRRFYEHHIRNDRDLTAHLHYCWYNPVKHGLCERPTDWPYSSIHRDAKLGKVDPEWIGSSEDLEAGEP